MVRPLGSGVASVNLLNVVEEGGASSSFLGHEIYQQQNAKNENLSNVSMLSGGEGYIPFCRL